MVESNLSFLYKLNPEQWQKLFGDDSTQQGVKQPNNGLVDVTLRQRQVLSLRFRQGFTQSDTAHEIGISSSTVRKEEQALLNKLASNVKQRPAG